MTNIAIIGAGLSGLTAANILKDYSNITLFEKSRGVSGRMSTRRAEPFFLIMAHSTSKLELMNLNISSPL